MYTVTFDHFNVGHGGYHALTLAVVEEGTLLNLVYVLVQSSTRLVDHIKIQNKQRRELFILLGSVNWKGISFLFHFYNIAFDEWTGPNIILACFTSHREYCPTSPQFFGTDFGTKRDPEPK